MNDPLVLGVDGGGTSTVAWLARPDGPILGRGVSGPSNAKAIGPETARAALREAISRARGDSGVGEHFVEVACLGLAGFDRPDDRALLASWCEQDGWAGRLLAVNDGDLVLAAGTPEGFGVALIAGTGSIAVGRARDGISARAGGWGPLIGDEGSAYWVALAGLRLVTRRFDGRIVAPAEDRLSESLCRALGVESPRQIITALHGRDWDRSRIAGLARLIVDCSGDDPEVCSMILSPAAEELATLVLSVSDRIGEGIPPLAISGGFLLGADVLREEVLRILSGRVYSVREVAEPVEGAVVLARRALA